MVYHISGSIHIPKKNHQAPRSGQVTVVKVFPSAPMATSTASQCRPRSSAAEANGAVWLMSVYLTGDRSRWAFPSPQMLQLPKIHQLVVCLQSGAP